MTREPGQPDPRGELPLWRESAIPEGDSEVEDFSEMYDANGRRYAPREHEESRDFSEGAS